MSEFITLFIPFAGTTLGAAMVFFMKDKISPLVEKALLGFAAGHDRGVHMVTAHSVHRHGGGTGKDSVAAGTYRIYSWNHIPACS